MKFPVLDPGSSPVMESPFLPIPETVPASNIETREEVKILTGKKIHALMIDGVLTVSPEIYKSLKNQTKTNEQNS